MRKTTLAVALALGCVLANGTALAAERKARGDKLPSGAAKVEETKFAADAQDPSREVAERYLKAIAREGSEDAIETLLGGATLTARIYTIENWRIVGRESHRRESGDLADLHAYVNAIDKAGRDALARMVGGGPGSPDEDGLAVQELSAEQAQALLEPTRTRARQFAKTHPVFAYVARVDKQVYWHPKNPFRKLLADAGTKGRYTCDFDLFWVETVEGRHEDKLNRRWPLRVVRFVADGVDTGLKILPASDWNAE